MPNYNVSPATFADLPAIATVSRAAFKNSPRTMSYWMFPQDNEEAIYKWRLHSIINRFNNDPNCYLVKCVETATGKIVAFALWQRPHKRETEEGENNNDAAAKGREGMDEALPEGTNVPLMNDFDEATQRMRSKYVDTEKDYGKQISRGYGLGSSNHAGVDGL